MSAWTTYNTTLTCIVDETEYDIPVHNMSVSSGPYSRVAGDSVVVRAFDGRYYSRHQGWRTRATLSWDYLTSDAQEVLRAFIVAALEHGSFQAVFNPESGTQIVEMVIDDANEALVAVFDGNNRFRTVSISFISVNISDVAPNWITDEEVPVQFEYVYSIVGTSPDSSWIVRSIRDEENLGSWSSEILVTEGAVNGKAFVRLRVDENAGFIFVTVWDSIAESTELRKYPITGGSSYDSLFTISKEIVGFDIDRVNNVCFLSTISGVFGTALMYKVSYAGSATLLYTWNPSINGGLYGTAYGRDGFVYYLQTNQSVSNPHFKRISSDGITNVLLAEMAITITFAMAQANASVGYYFHMNNSGIYRIPLPGGGSNSLMSSPVQPGVAVDWINGFVYYGFGTGSAKQIRREPIGGGTEEVVAIVNTGNSFDDFDLGI